MTRASAGRAGGGPPAVAGAVIDAIRRGAMVFVIVASLGIVGAVAGNATAGGGLSLATAARLGTLYLGPFHHVPIVIEGDLDVDAASVSGTDLPRGGSLTVQVGVALLAITAVATWLLFRAGRTATARVVGGPTARALVGAAVAAGYAVPIWVVALTISSHEHIELGSLVTGEVTVRLATWAALVVPLLLAAIAGGSGGVWSWVDSRSDHPNVVRAGAVLAGAWLMLWLALGLSYAGLLVAGALQPDEPVALLTPSTARYVDTVFERPWLGVVIVGHHVALWPAEGAWALVPAMGGCDEVGANGTHDLICLRSAWTGRSPIAALAEGEVRLERLPAAYLLFALAPAAAAALAGRWAAHRAEVAGRTGAILGALAGVAFALLVVAVCLLATVTLRYDASAGARGGSGAVRWGPDPLRGGVLALGWGGVAGALGAWSVGVRRSEEPRRSGAAATR